MTTHSENKTWYIEQFRKFEQRLNGQRTSPLHAIRTQAIEQFAQLHFPSAGNEDWKYTNIEPVLKHAFEPSLTYSKGAITSGQIASLAIEGLSCMKLVFINGNFAEELSSPIPSHAAITNISDAMPDHAEMIQSHLHEYLKSNGDIFSSLNSAFLMNGAFIQIPDGVNVEEPIHLLFINTSKEKTIISQPFNLIIAGKHSQATIIETYASLDDAVAFTNSLTLVSADDHAALNYVKLQNENDKTYHIDTTHFDLQRSTNVMSTVITFGGALTRNLFRANLNAEGVECTLNGLYLTHDDRHVDNRTVIHHAKPHCNSHELYKGILDGRSTGVFNGKIIVHQDAQKTDAKQSNKNLLLSKDATINTKPQLEIFADDVKCTHGATIGRLDKESLFYLRSRGISRENAQNMLTYAFAGEVVSKISHEPVRTYLDNLLFARLAH
jgi:Fe-S cluster assembly protein SufD